jgi:hypothetical protein
VRGAITGGQKAYVGKDACQIVDIAYQNPFGRPAEEDGKMLGRPVAGKGGYRQCDRHRRGRCRRSQWALQDASDPSQVGLDTLKASRATIANDISLGRNRTAPAAADKVARSPSRVPASGATGRSPAKIDFSNGDSDGWLIIDTNGDSNDNAGADMVILMYGNTAPLAVTDFIFG